MSTRTFYEILNAQQNASFNELKANYKQLILQCHPDKLHDTETKATNAEIVPATVIVAVDPHAAAAAATNIDSNFVEINKAWNTLKDPIQRKLYDAELLSTRFQTHSNIFERLKLADLNVEYIAASAAAVDDESDAAGRTKLYTYDCRCGGQYVVDESVDNEIIDGSNDEVIVECSECSLVIILNG